MNKGFKLLRDLSVQLNIKESLMQKAQELLKKVEDDGRLKGKSMNAKVATIIFITSRQAEQPKPIK